MAKRARFLKYIVLATTEFPEHPPQLTSSHTHHTQVFTLKHLERTPGKRPVRSLQDPCPHILGVGNPSLNPTEKLRTVRRKTRKLRCSLDTVPKRSPHPVARTWVDRTQDIHPIRRKRVGYSPVDFRKLLIYHDRKGVRRHTRELWELSAESV